MNLNRSIPADFRPEYVTKRVMSRFLSTRAASRVAIILLCLLLSQQSLVQLQAQNNLDIEAANYPSNAQSVQSAFQPTGSIYATFFYPWYKSPSVDGAWGNWEGNGHTPPTNWFSNFLPIPPGAYNATSGVINPTIGLYSSRDKGTFYWQLNQMATAKIEVAISSWWGQSVSPTNDSPGIYATQGRTDVSFRQIVTNWMNQADNPYPNMRWALYYEKESIANPSITEIVSDLKYINTNYVNQPSFLKIDGRPVLFVYADGTDGCSMVTRWLQARAQSGVNFYLVLKLFSGYTNCSSQPDSWHQYAPAVRTATHSPYSAFISPGFWKEGNSPLLARSTTDFETAAVAMVAANTQWKLVETWNEWGEGTSVEPGIQMQQTKTGTAIVALNGAPFQSQYIQIMARRFPALPAGTGAGIQATATPSPTPRPATATPSPTPRPATATPTATSTVATAAPATSQGASVFLILMENHNWNQIKGSSSAPYINSLLSQGAHAEAYYNPPGLHPSEPNYLWLEAGTNFGIKDDNPPSTNHQSSTAHLTTQLNSAGISWKSYQEDISGTVCPLSGTGKYAPKHNPMVFFNDVTGTNNSLSPYCIAHVRPYTELATDIAAGIVPRYSFITPNLCNDMHDSSGCASSDSIKNGDNWLSKAIPAIQASNAYKNGGTIIITWDEGEGSDGPIGLIVLSPNAKRGYSNTIHYTHSSTLRTLQTLLGVGPLLGDAAHATDLSDLFANTTSTSTVTPPPTQTNTPVTPTPTAVAFTATPANSLTFNPVADSAVDSSSSSSNYGISTTVRTDASPVVRTYMRFDVQGISGSVTTAKLRIYANSSSSMKYDVRPVSSTNWGETTITYSNAPSVGGIVSSSVASFKSSSWTEVDVTSLIQANGLVSLALTSDNSTSVSYGSRESTHKPQLIIQTGAAMAAPMQALVAVAAVSSPTPTNTITPMPTNTITSTPTSAPTETTSATLPSTPTNESGLVAPTIPANFSIVESDSPVVSGVSAWRQMSQPAGTSGGTYILNIDLSGTLSLHFNGQAIGVDFVTGPSFGQFTIEVDGVTKQVINANSNDYSIGQVMVADLSVGDHDMRILPAAGVVAIDSFLVMNAPATQVAEQPTNEQTLVNTETVIAPTTFVPTIEATQPLSTSQTEQASSLPTALPFPTLDIPTEVGQVPTEIIPATNEIGSLPTALPFPTVDIPTTDASQSTLISPTQISVLPISSLPITASMDDGAADWQTVGSWTLLPESAYGSAGLGWQARGGNSDVLHWNRQIDLRGATGVQLSFQTQLSNASAPLLVQMSLDGIAWTTIATLTATPDWQLTTVDLSAYEGQIVQLQFVWTSNVPGDLLRLDDVMVTASVPGAPTSMTTVPALPTNENSAPSPEPPTLAQSPTLEMSPAPTLAAPTDTPVIAATSEATEES